MAGCLVLEDEAILLGSNERAIERGLGGDFGSFCCCLAARNQHYSHSLTRALPSSLPSAMLRLGSVQAATVVVVVCVALALAQVNPNVYPRTRVFDTSSGPVQGAYSISQ